MVVSHPEKAGTGKGGDGWEGGGRREREGVATVKGELCTNTL